MNKIDKVLIKLPFWNGFGECPKCGRITRHTVCIVCDARSNETPEKL